MIEYLTLTMICGWALAGIAVIGAMGMVEIIWFDTNFRLWLLGLWFVAFIGALMGVIL